MRNGQVTKPYEFIGFGAMEVTKPYEFIGFGAMEVTKPYEFIGFGAMEVTKPYEFIGFGAMEVLQPTKLAPMLEAELCFFGINRPSVQAPAEAPSRARLQHVTIQQHEDKTKPQPFKKPWSIIVIGPKSILMECAGIGMVKKVSKSSYRAVKQFPNFEKCETSRTAIEHSWSTQEQLDRP